MASRCLAGFAAEFLAVVAAAVVQGRLGLHRYLTEFPGSAAFVEEERLAWKAFVADLAPRAAPAVKKTAKQGVVIIGGRSHYAGNGLQYYTLDALLAIASLRYADCKLPVELWHDHDPALSGNIGETAASHMGSVGGQVFFRDITEVPGGRNLTGYMLSSFVLLHSSFESFLYLDADNLAAADPTPLFTVPGFTQTGALFWPDPQIWKPTSLIWRVLGCKCMPMRAMENGQMLIDSVRHWQSLELANFLNQRYATQYFRPPLFLFGDRDMFAYAWLALSATFSVAPPVGLGGHLAKGRSFCGHSYLQFHPQHPEEVVFLHRTFAKLSLHRDGSDPRVAVSKRMVGLARDRLAPGHCSPHRHEHPIHQGHRMIDFSVEIDNTTASKDTLVRLAQLEDDMIQLRSLIADTEGLRPQWWLHWAGRTRQGRQPQEPENSRGSIT